MYSPSQGKGAGSCYFKPCGTAAFRHCFHRAINCLVFQHRKVKYNRQSQQYFQTRLEAPVEARFV